MQIKISTGFQNFGRNGRSAGFLFCSSERRRKMLSPLFLFWNSRELPIYWNGGAFLKRTLPPPVFFNSAPRNDGTPDAVLFPSLSWPLTAESQGIFVPVDILSNTELKGFYSSPSSSRPRPSCPVHACRTAKAASLGSRLREKIPLRLPCTRKGS